MNRTHLWLLSASLALASAAFAEVTVQTEQLNPADPSWNFKTIPRPSKSDIAQSAKVTMVGNQFEPAGADGSVLVNGILPGDSLDLSEEALLSNANAMSGSIVIDLGRGQPVAAVASLFVARMERGSRARARRRSTRFTAAPPRIPIR